MICFASPFDTIVGLPMHPLIVHFTIVLLPLASIALGIMVFVPRMAKRYAAVAMSAFVVGLGAAVLSLLSGDALAQRVGEPGDHSMWAAALTAVAAVALVVMVAWYWLNKVAERDHGKSAADQAENQIKTAVRNSHLHVLRISVAVLCAVVLVLTVIVGHTGTRATWGDVVNSALTETR